jgi:sorbitol-specific phosphotransferase system component IIC
MRILERLITPFWKGSHTAEPTPYKVAYNVLRVVTVFISQPVTEFITLELTRMTCIEHLDDIYTMVWELCKASAGLMTGVLPIVVEMLNVSGFVVNFMFFLMFLLY